MKEMIVKDFMNTNFAKISDDMPVITASIELIKKEALGGPVVDKGNKLLGWISEQECLQVTTQFAYHNQRVALVKDIMREDVLSIKMDQTIFSLAEKMIGTQPKNYPVVDNSNKVIGVISRRQVLKSLLDNVF
ncbi:CBS domain-containing protein [Psychromonas marina]|uniref:CBS domain-containing protein n=1 Tax=Psychromonas marina TaxID=88364 RepID=A0ABQ6E363_9GAMM|nr:CBS domain-containing protein [Psychromonas marina]GLS91867.1 CBS domain-containing protein [Psychromonas marina]